MFDPSDRPRVFAVPPGVDFPAAVVRGLITRSAGLPPEELARTELVINTRRMQRRIRALFDTGPARLLPRLMMLTDLAQRLPHPAPPVIPPLRRRLELAQLVTLLIEREPDLAPRAAAYDLADSLAALIDEMQGEGVAPEVLQGLDISDMSGHWQRALKFIAIAETLVGGDTAGGLDPEARQRWIVQALIRNWQSTPPQTPLILAGSTGSRGTTLLLMQAIARLPQGALILPGFDTDMAAEVWDSLTPEHSDIAEDHPQYRFLKILKSLDLHPSQVPLWTDDLPYAPARNRAVSLALRPAPVTDAWLREGPALRDLDTGFGDVTLIEAPDPRTEALTIALRLREAAETGQSAALITPDRMLTRQVAAALDRWDIIPDDSAGQPLHLSPPGRFLRHVAQLFARPLDGELLLTLLKHPLTHSGDARNRHLLFTRDYELHLRRHGPPCPDADTLIDWGAAHGAAADWGQWAAAQFTAQPVTGPQPLPDWITLLQRRAEAIAAGSVGDGTGGLWDGPAGEAALSVITALTAEAQAGGDMSARDFSDLLAALLQKAEVRDAIAPHPGIMIWGTLEARVQGADLVILGGLNEGSWPASAQPDPWLNRSLRRRAGLLPPDRQIGLSAHDFQQAVAAREVWMTRAIRNDDAETVPARWINRLTNLLSGIPEAGGPQVLTAMRDRGRRWLDQARVLDAAPRVPLAPRPCPRPPLSARPRQLSVTEIKTLIRDPYAIYARRVLGLSPLDPLVPEADALSRGVVLHAVLERFVKETHADPSRLSRDHLMRCTSEVLDRDVPWPTAHRFWLARVAKFADWFVDRETTRQRIADPVAFETRLKGEIPDLGFSLTGQADRLDRDAAGDLLIYDYKTGAAPSEREQTHFDKQLLLEAAIAEQFGVDGIPPAPVARAVFIGLGKQAEVDAPLIEEPTGRVWAEFRDLIAAYLDETQGFTSRRMLQKDSDIGRYDHLARYGEWDRSTAPGERLAHDTQ